MKHASEFIIIIFLCLFLNSCAQDRKEQLIITSCVEFLDLSEKLASDFQLDKNFFVSVKGSFGGEINLIKTGLTDIIVTGSEIQGEASENLEQIKIAENEMLVIVNSENKIQELQTEELKEIFTGKQKYWFSGDKSEILPINREYGSGIRNSFEKIFLSDQVDNGKISVKSLTVNSNAEMKTAVASIKSSIGYISSGLIKANIENTEKIKKLRIINKKTKLNISLPKNSVYIVYIKNSKNQKIRDFINYLKNNQQAKNIITEEGSVALL